MISTTVPAIVSRLNLIFLPKLALFVSAIVLQGQKPVWGIHSTSHERISK